jgi:hypothetical protein
VKRESVWVWVGCGWGEGERESVCGERERERESGGGGEQIRFRGSYEVTKEGEKGVEGLPPPLSPNYDDDAA